MRGSDATTMMNDEKRNHVMFSSETLVIIDGDKRRPILSKTNKNRENILDISRGRIAPLLNGSIYHFENIMYHSRGYLDI